MATNPFGWQQVQLKDTGSNTQNAIYNAQRAVGNITDIADDFQSDVAKVDANNFTQQGKLNNQEIARQIRESGLSAEEFSQAQNDGEFSTSSFQDKYGINFTQDKAQTGINAQQAELARKEIQDIADISKNIDGITSHGVGGLNADKARIMSYAVNPTQRAEISTMFDAQETIAVDKRDTQITAAAMKEFGGLQDDGIPNTVKIREYAKNQASKYGYNQKQTDALVAKVDQAEMASTQLSGTQQAFYERESALHTENKSIVMASLLGKLTTVQPAYQTARAKMNTVDMVGDTSTSEQLMSKAAGGASRGDMANALAKVTKLGANLVIGFGKDGKPIKGEASPGRMQAIKTHVLSLMTEESGSDFDNLVINAIAFNNENFSNFKADTLDTLQQYEQITSDISGVKKESARFSIDMLRNAQQGKGVVKQPVLENLMNGIQSTVYSDKTQAQLNELRNQFTTLDTQSNTVAVDSDVAAVDVNNAEPVVTPTPASNVEQQTFEPTILDTINKGYEILDSSGLENRTVGTAAYRNIFNQLPFEDQAAVKTAQSAMRRDTGGWIDKRNRLDATEIGKASWKALQNMADGTNSDLVKVANELRRRINSGPLNPNNKSLLREVEKQLANQ